MLEWGDNNTLSQFQETTRMLSPLLYCYPQQKGGGKKPSEWISTFKTSYGILLY